MRWVISALQSFGLAPKWFRSTQLGDNSVMTGLNKWHFNYRPVEEFAACKIINKKTRMIAHTRHP